MKKLFLIFLLPTILLAQRIEPFKVVGDTTDLKNTSGSGIIFLEQFGGGSNNGGGFFHRIDSTYAEGVNAFDYPYNGYQWARINLIDQYLSPGSADYNIPVWDGEKYISVPRDSLDDLSNGYTFENGEQITNTTDADLNIIFDDDAATLGQVFVESSVDTPGIADNDNLEMIFRFNDDSSELTNYGTVKVTATDVSDESEDSRIEFKTYAAGSQKTPLIIDGNNIVGRPYNFATASQVTGTADSIKITFDVTYPPITAGAEITFIAEANNTGAAKLVVGSTEVEIRECSDKTALEADDIRNGMVVKLTFDGTYWIQISQSGN